MTPSRHHQRARWCPTAVALLLATLSLSATAAIEDSASRLIEFNDQPLSEGLILPDWFKLSFLELKTDVDDARNSKKKGLIIYFGQSDCPYCKAHLEKTWGERGIVKYTRDNFDVVAVDVRGDRPVADVKGNIYRTEKDFAVKMRTQFTPSFLFYDAQGNEVLRLAGYRPPYQFQAVLEYVADGHYKKERLNDFLARGEKPNAFEESELHHNDIFGKPPFVLDRTKPAQRPLVVFFEKPTCHACDVLHAGPMTNPEIVKKLKKLDVIQLDATANTPVVIPSGHTLSAHGWADNLDLYYAPTVVFFDEYGMEILRIDSVVWFYRLNSVLEYVTSGAYREYNSFQLWRQANKR